MANENEPRTRIDPVAGRAGALPVGKPGRAAGAGELPLSGDDRVEDPEQEVENRGIEESVETEEERIEREKREWLEEIDSTEIVDSGVSSTAYRRAVAVFDEKDTTSVQLAEHWNFTAGDYERNGRF